MGNADGRPATLVLLRVALNVQPAAAAAGGLVGSKLNVISLSGFDLTGRGGGRPRVLWHFFLRYGRGFGAGPTHVHCCSEKHCQIVNLSNAMSISLLSPASPPPPRLST